MLLPAAGQTRHSCRNPDMKFSPIYIPVSISLGSNSDQQPCQTMHLFLHGGFRKAKEIERKMTADTGTNYSRNIKGT